METVQYTLQSVRNILRLALELQYIALELAHCLLRGHRAGLRRVPCFPLRHPSEFYSKSRTFVCIIHRQSLSYRSYSDFNYQTHFPVIDRLAFPHFSCHLLLFVSSSYHLVHFITLLLSSFLF